MQAKTIAKYQDKSIPKLLKTAEKYFNEFIRLRDSEDGIGYCISSGKMLRVPSMNAQAGHYYPAGKVSSLKFHEDNVHLQGKSDNYFASGNLSSYRLSLEQKIGKERLENLDHAARYEKKHGWKWDRFYLIEVIETYKAKVKGLKS